VTNQAVELFALGYTRATVGHPVGLTERARRACLAAYRVAEAVPSPSGLPSLLLGQLEGIWAVIYGRREEIEKLHAGAFKEILKSISKLDWQSIVDAVETQLLIDPSISGKMLANEIQTRIVSMISGDLPPDARAAWRSTISAALVDGTAEGQTAATAILKGAASIDWELTAAEAKAALDRGVGLGDTVDTWILKQTHGLGYQVSRKLAALWDAGASKQEMITAIMEMLGSTENIASVLLDTAIGQAISQGALDTYSAANIQKADFVTAGDSRVCPTCSSAEDGNPYSLYGCPQPPLHIRCRCTVAPSDYFPSLSLVPSEDS
jgi:SPP1 gp7 family putative phage head morphogenesis protein